ncbi:hypothetical protein EHQ12_00590 [Leptospira gomenensis]|uniref:Uncharacterized protein n=1 Tax=Leptospira gomenensis TaxID=2484974 RepID=A0A5F1Z1D3_9LEPT|nr:hypothetical protein [Leptospira gomenensis]TGK39189.1 hypothetical protein EHQ17_00490 [Leptospira gomenensis]TGK44270.1 hypothetical protein EHQ07_12215 [Leptospira gomenensis]TGK45060.1 hypothetical protein EHQ12_00590 [Leptospira gomenensis]TGK65132.1 hypothetical protein EHQ13_06190 [Leptospira gomenensis]
MITRYKLEYLKQSMRLLDLKNADGEVRSESEIRDLLLTRCALQEYYLEKRNLLPSYHVWLEDQGLGEWASH